MKFLSTLILLITSCLPGFSQTAAFSEPKPFNFSKDIFTIGSWRGKYLPVFYTEKSKSFLDLFNRKMERKAIVTLNFFPEKVNMAELYDGLGTQINVLYSGILGNKEIFYAAQLDEDGKLLKGPIVLDTANTTFVRKQKKTYYFLSSPLQKYSALFGFQIKDDLLLYGYKILDQNLQIVGSDQGQLSAKNKSTVDHILLTENADLLILCSDKNDNRAQVITKADLHVLNSRGAVSKEVPLGNNVVESLVMKSDYAQPNTVYLAGFFKPYRSGYLLGTYLCRHNLEEPTLQGRFVDFSDSLRNIYKVKNKKKELNLFTVKDLVVKNDGGLIVFAEAFFEIIRNFGNGTRYDNFSNLNIGQGNSHEFNFGDIMLMDFDKSFSNNWFTLIEKEQRSLDDNGVFSSFSVLNSGATLGLLYNKMFGNSNRPQYTVVDATGNKTYSNLPRVAGTSAWLNILAKQIGMKEMVVPIISGTNLIFGKLQF